MKSKIREITIRCSLTKFECNCGHRFYVRASYFNCPKCKTELQRPIILENCLDIVNSLSFEFVSRRNKYGLKDEILNDCLLCFPGYTFEGLKTIWEDIC